MTSHRQGISLILNLVLNVVQQALEVVILVSSNQVISSLTDRLDKLAEVCRGEEPLVTHEPSQLAQGNTLIA